ncbi:MAG: hypothetical protein LR017_01955 [Candidatus Pacebacteria bacterium]|nr:hypothetical protein [Candidatus Paceibacterota bacterium]
MSLFNRKQKKEISFEEILLDASNLPSFDTGRMEGHMELPLSRVSIMSVGIVFVIIASVFTFKLFTIQVVEGDAYAARSENNRVSTSVIVAERGAIYDRRGDLIVWNERDQEGEYGFPMRAYTDRKGFGQLIGYVSYPKTDAAGFYYRTEYVGRSGVEEAYHDALSGANGEQLVEVNAVGEVISNHVVRAPTPGDDLVLSIDAELSEEIYTLLATTTETNGFRTGAAAIMDVHTGALLALSSFPSYDPEVLADGDDADAIAALNNDNRYPFLNKVVGGVYTPGSIVKPIVAYAALVENIIDPMQVMYSNGSLVVPNPYNPSNPTIFRDWRAHGKMTMRDAIAYSSNVYFYTIGGGFGDQKGLGITKINEYMRLFGLGEKTGVQLLGEQKGTVPNPEWKRAVFDDDWRLGDTYLTSIGQFGFQVTPIQMLRAYAALANGGTLITPHIVYGAQGATRDIMLDTAQLQIIQEGMRQTVIQDGGTARALERKDVAVAGKSGTAELGHDNARVNSWISGYFPYEEPQYAFVLFMENGPRANTVGASSVMGKVLDWIGEHRPEYFGIEENS